MFIQAYLQYLCRGEFDFNYFYLDIVIYSLLMCTFTIPTEAIVEFRQRCLFRKYRHFVNIKN